MKDFLQKATIPQRNVTSTQLLALMKTINSIISNEAGAVKVQRESLYDIFQWLY